MTRQRTAWWTAVVVTVAAQMLCGVQSGWAVESGPEPGAALPALKAQAVVDTRAADVKDIVAERGQHPTVYVFLNDSRFDRPAAQYLRSVDELVQKLQRREPLSGMVIVWLSDDAENRAERVSRFQSALRLPAGQWVIDPNGNSGSDGWALNDQAAVTAVLAHNQKVVARFAYDSLNGTDAEALGKAIEALKLP